MALTTYDELQTAVANWLDRSDLTSRIPEFIALTEARLNRRLRTRETSEIATASVSSEFTALPTDFLDDRALRITDGTNIYELMRESPEVISQWKSWNNATSIPQFYTIQGAEFQVYPSPNATFTATLIYRQKVPALTTSNTSNWVLVKAPDLYLYGALLQAAPYLRDPEALASWTVLFEQALSELITSERPTVGTLRVDDGLQTPRQYRFNINRGW